MSRKTVPLLLVSIAALFLALVIIILVMLMNDQSRRISGTRRRVAVTTLLSRRPPAELDDKRLNLAGITAYISMPLNGGGSLNNLNHYISKDPGRREFQGSGDRRRAAEYLEGSEPWTESGEVPSWVPGYLGSVSWLFEAVKSDIFDISGYPGELTFLAVPEDNGPSASEYTVRALGRFADTWIPAGETLESYRTDRQMVREWLLGNRKFGRRMIAMDEAWKNLIASLYNLSTDPNWQTAVSYAPHLQDELEELIILVLSADIHHRSLDLMALVDDADRVPGTPPGPGITWSPEFSYYKNIPEITGYTSDEEPIIFFSRVSLSYTFRDGRTQTWLNRRKDWLSDYFQSFFSATKRNDFSPRPEDDPAIKDWAAARLKARSVHGINSRIILAMPFGRRKVHGVRDVSFVRVNLLANP